MATKVSENRIFALVWRIVGLVVGLFGMITLLVLASGAMGAKMLAYFTIQSNIFVLALFAILIVLSSIQIAKSGTKGTVACINPIVQLAIVFFITITGVVYWGILSWQSFQMSGTAAAVPAYVLVLNQISNIIVHGLVPIFAVVDWLLFMPHGKLNKKAALWWLSYPLVYGAFIFILGATTTGFFKFSPTSPASNYPYPFIDVDKLGWGVTAIIVVALAIAFYLLGRLYILMDNKLAARIKKGIVSVPSDTVETLSVDLADITATQEDEGDKKEE